MMASFPRRERAFTIIEVLVSVSILMLIIFAVYGTWTAILRASATAHRAAFEVQRSRIAVRAVEDSLITATMYGENARYYYFVADTQDEDFAYLTLVSRLPEGFPGYERYPDQNLRRITFEVVPAEDGKKELVMTQFPVMALTNETTQPYKITLVRDITWFGLDFWDPQKNDWMKEFTATNQLPRMMRVIIGWGHLPNNTREPAEVIARTVAIPASVVMGEVQRPAGEFGGAPGGNQNQNQNQNRNLGATEDGFTPGKGR